MAPRGIPRSHLALRYALLVAVVARAQEVFNTTPPPLETSFSCLNRPMGFYADVEANCRVYHMCDDHGNQFSYRCPEETAFRQDALICDHAHLVDCRATVHPPNLIPSENRVDGAAGLTPRSAYDERRPSLSRSFRVIQRPDESASPGNRRSGFVFSASLFLRDQDRARSRDAGASCGRCDGSRATTATAYPTRAHVERYHSRDDGPTTGRPPGRPARPSPPTSTVAPSTSGFRGFDRREPAYPRRVYETTASPVPAQHLTPPPPPSALFSSSSSSSSSSFSSSSSSSSFSSASSSASSSSSSSSSSFQRGKSSAFDRNQDQRRPYTETLRSIQAIATTARPTTEHPARALTLSLKPLVPNELEYDPYYPRQPTSTEAYYTPSDRSDRRDAAGPRSSNDAGRRTSSSSSSSPVARRNPLIEIPAVLPDLNSLEDLVDRRKFFYIPRAGVKV